VRTPGAPGCAVASGTDLLAEGEVAAVSSGFTFSFENPTHPPTNILARTNIPDKFLAEMAGIFSKRVPVKVDERVAGDSPAFKVLSSLIETRP
jgi:hypothetical protein